MFAKQTFFKTVLLGASLIGSCTFLIGCVFTPTANQSLTAPPAAKAGDIIDAAVDAASTAGLPGPTTVDKANGLVQFGNYTMSEIGYSAQVRIRSDGSLDVTVKRCSVYVPLPVDEKAKAFFDALAARLQKFKSVRIYLHLPGGAEALAYS